MNKGKYSSIISLWLFGFAALLLVYGMEMQEIFTKRIEQQQNITRNVSQVKATYDALKPTIKAWENSFTDSEDIISIISLFRALNIGSSGLVSHGNDFIEGSLGSVTYQGADLGLKLLIANIYFNFATYFMALEAYAFKLSDGVDYFIMLRGNFFYLTELKQVSH